MSYLDFLAGWWAGWSVNRDSVVALELRVGPREYDKKSSSLAAESETLLGSLTVWDSGELEAEVMEWSSQNRTYVDSAVVKDHEDLAFHLSRFVRTFE